MNSAFEYDSHVLNLGHRGAREVAPENTLASFLKAIELGADGVELDVMLSRDGQVVVIHDSSVDRTTDGTGRVNELSLAELKALDAGSWFSGEYAGERIPTLDEVMDALPSESVINIELKSLSPFDHKLVTSVGRIVERHGRRDRVIISSFNPLLLWRTVRLDPAYQTGLLSAQSLPVFLRDGWLAPLVHAAALHPEYQQVSPAYVRRARLRGYHLNVWNANQIDQFRTLMDLGVDSIITDRPDRLSLLLGQ